MWRNYKPSINGLPPFPLPVFILAGNALMAYSPPVKTTTHLLTHLSFLLDGTKYYNPSESRFISLPFLLEMKRKKTSFINLN